MDATSFKRWCFANIIWPGVALVDYNDTRDQCFASCHMPAPPPAPGSRFLDLMEANWILVFIITTAIVMSVGVVLAVHHMRWRRVLLDQLEAGHIDREQYDRLR